MGAATRRARGLAGASLLGLVLLAGCARCDWATLAACEMSRGSQAGIASPGPGGTPGPGQSPGAGGIAIIAIPTPAPLVCSPASITVPVSQTAIVDCTSQSYFGPFTWSLSDPSVASVQLAAGTYTFFYINGLAPGTTTLALQFPDNGVGSVVITVTP